MEYRRFGDTIVARLDRGEEILEQVERIARQEKLQLASVQALGAVDSFTVGVYDTQKKAYRANHFEGSYEIVSLTGTVDTMQGAFYCHLHMSAGNAEGAVFGGHLNTARVSATCELLLREIPGRVDRERDASIGLNLWHFM